MKVLRNQLGRLHCVDGPAIEDSTGAKEWWVNDRPHRLDGPAVVCSDGTSLWIINGKDITKEVVPWLKEQGFTIPLDDQAQTLFILRFL